MLKKNGFADLNVLIAHVLNPREGSMSNMYDLALSAAKTPRGSFSRRRAVDCLIKRMHTGATSINASDKMRQKLYKMGSSLFAHSMYFPAIQYWKNVLGDDQVLVVAAERLRQQTKTSKNAKFIVGMPIGWDGGQVMGQKSYGEGLSDTRDNGTEISSLGLRKGLLEQMQDIQRFIGLCVWSKAPSADEHKTFMKIGKGFELNASMEAVLQRFFRPFNHLLYDTVSDNFGY